MAIRGSTDIDRPPDQVYAYSVDPARRRAWQAPVLEIEQLSPGALTAGTRVRERREVGGRARSFVWEYTGLDPGRSWSFRGLDGPVRAEGTMRFTPTDGGAATHVEFDFDLVGHGFGRLFARLARRGAPEQVAQDLGGLKRELEGGAAA
jgi:uncharacterized protein YndB with AHSA1/START domain